MTPPEERPLCECHGESMFWHKAIKRPGGGYWQCRIRKNELNRIQARSNQAYFRRHRNLPKQKERVAEYNSRPEVKERKRLWAQAYHRENYQAKGRPYRIYDCPECRGTLAHGHTVPIDQMCPLAIEKQKAYKREWQKRPEVNEHRRERYHDPTRHEAVKLRNRLSYRRLSDSKDQAIIDKILTKYPELKEILSGITP